MFAVHVYTCTHESAKLPLQMYMRSVISQCPHGLCQLYIANLSFIYHGTQTIFINHSNKNLVFTISCASYIQLVCLSFTMVHRPSSLIIVTKIWCLPSVGVEISKEALDRPCPHQYLWGEWIDGCWRQPWLSCYMYTNYQTSYIQLIN